MNPRRLSPEEEALWRRATEAVTPLPGRVRPAAPPPDPGAASAAPPAPARPAPQVRPAGGPARRPRGPGETLDGRWDRRLARGRVRPDHVLDLHGMSREAARAALFREILGASRRGSRLLLVITGKGAQPGPAPADLAWPVGPPPRGVIRAELPRWLAEPSVANHIAAVRCAHPRHGGAGAVYLVLRRQRPGGIA